MKFSFFLYIYQLAAPLSETRRNFVDLPLPRYLWKVMKNTSRTERLSCAAAVIALIICLALVLYFTLSAKSTYDDNDDIAPHEWNISRSMWLARSANNTSVTEPFEPLRLVVIQHTVSQVCERFITCAAEIRNLQLYFLTTCQYDIPYNFIIGNDGRVYEGRGWGMVGAHTYGYNRCGLGLGFIGDYREEIESHAQVTQLQINRTMMLLEEGVRRGILHPNYHVAGARDLRQTDSPGSNLYNAMQLWEHYDHEHLYRGKTCEEIHAMYNDNTTVV